MSLCIALSEGEGFQPAQISDEKELKRDAYDYT